MAKPKTTKTAAKKKVPASKKAPAAPKKAPAAAGIGSPPAQGAPSPPKGFTPPGAGRKGKTAPTAQQVRDADDVARELGAATYRDDFGARAPDPVALASALRVAQAWSQELDAAEQWQTYARAQADAAWAAVFADTKKLGAEFQLAEQHDPAVAKRYTQTRGFLNVRREAAAKGAVTRKKKRSAAPA